MIFAANVEDGLRIARSTVNFRGSLLPVLGAHPVPGFDSVGLDVPQAFLVEQSANWILPTHYHTEHQFQLVARGSGRLGRHDLTPLQLHYASPESGYGPVVAGERGLSYYTIRPRGTRDTWYLPADRPRMRLGLRKLNALGGAVQTLSPNELVALSQRHVDVVMRGKNGLGAWMLRLPGGAFVDVQKAEPWSGMRFYYVAAGAIAWCGREITVGGMACVDGCQEMFSAQAQGLGAEVLIMRFPDHCLETYG
jgi:hypothetical protein